MGKIRHIALTTEKPEEVAAFYKEAFDMQERIRNDRQVLLSDGYINLTITKWKTEQDVDVGPDGPNYSGIHHIGFQVDDLDATSQKMGAAKKGNCLPPEIGLVNPRNKQDEPSLNGLGQMAS